MNCCRAFVRQRASRAVAAFILVCCFASATCSQRGEDRSRRIDHPNPRVRVMVAEKLGKTRNPRVVRPLIAALGDENVEVRLAARDALLQIGEPAVNPLIRALKDEEGRYSGLTRGFAAQALGILGMQGDRRALRPLIAALEDADSLVARLAAEALALMGDAQAVEPLVGALGSRVPEVRAAAAEALGCIPDARAVEPLAAALNDEYVSVSDKAAEALGRIKDPRAIEPLIGVLMKREPEDLAFAAGKKDLMLSQLVVLRRSAAGGLSDIGSPAVDPLITALADKSPHCRYWAAVALGAIGDSRALEPLAGLLNDAHRQVRWAAEEELRSIETARASHPDTGEHSLAAGARGGQVKVQKPGSTTARFPEVKQSEPD